MKKTIAAVTAGLLLVAGQAAAAQSSGAARVSDRIGAPAGESSELAGASAGGLLWAAATIAFLAYEMSNNDDSDSD